MPEPKPMSHKEWLYATIKHNRELGKHRAEESARDILLHADKFYSGGISGPLFELFAEEFERPPQHPAGDELQNWAIDWCIHSGVGERECRDRSGTSAQAIRDAYKGGFFDELERHLKTSPREELAMWRAWKMLKIERVRRGRSERAGE